MLRPFTLLCTTALSALTLASCGDDDLSSSAPASTPAATAQGAVDFAPIKTYLTEHTTRLTAATGELAAQAKAYHELAKSMGNDGAMLLKDHREDVATMVADMQKTWQKANPSYEEMEGVVAGVPSLASFDNILDAGTSGEDPENAVPFDLTYADGTVLKKPGNYFFLTETSLWGTEPKFTMEGTEPDLDDDGKVEYGEALPNPEHILAAAQGFDGQAKELAKSAAAWQPTESDVFNAVVVMTPTMSEYFEAWKNSRFVAGSKATEASFVGASRLGDIVGILSGLTVIYDGIEPKIATKDPQTAEQAGENLDGLLQYVTKLRDAETDGRTYTAEQAETYGTEAQRRAESIAGQVSQAADALGIKIEA